MTAFSHLLVADIGGTHTRFRLLEHAGGTAGCAVWSKDYPTKELASFRNALDRAFAECGQTPDRIVIAAAGPVANGRCTMPNVAWDIDLARDTDIFSDRVLLINDFVAQAMACLAPRSGETETLQEGVASKGATIGVIGAGTGLGMCLLVNVSHADHVRYEPVPSEGGHAPFAIAGHETEIRYLKHMTEHGVPPTGDTVVTGSGLERLHEFLTGKSLEAADIGKRIRSGVADATLSMFARFYGRCCRGLALHGLTTGGVHVCGGVAARTPEIVRHPEFLQEFANCAKYETMLRAMPVTLHLATDTGLDGAALLGKQHWT